MRSVGSGLIGSFWALPLFSGAVALSVVSVGCGSSTPSNPGSDGTSGGGAFSAGGSSGSAVAGFTSSGGSMLPAAGATGGAVSQGGDAPSAGGSAGNGAGAGAAAGASGGAGAGGNGGAAAGSGGAAGAPAAGNGCEGVTAKFCEDFEKQTSGAVPTGDFGVDAKAGAMVVDGTKPHGGKQSLHIKMAKPGARAMLDFSKQFPFNDQFGRAMMYLTAIPTNDTHWDLVYSYSETPQEEWELGGQNGIFALVIDPPDHEVNSKNNPIPTGKWFCVQWEFKYAGAGADNSYSAKVNGVALDKGEWTGADPSGMKWNAAPWKNLSVGWETYGGSNVDVENWIDDLAFGDQPIPCPAL